MRFRTTVSNVPLLHKIVRCLAALNKLCVIRLSPEKVHFIIPSNENRDGVQVWSQVKVNTLFSNYRIESNSENEIWLEIHLEALLKVLKSADSSAGSTMDGGRNNSTALHDSEVSLKLNKRGNQAIWAFDIRGSSQNGKPMSITHEINIHVLAKKRQEELTEPLCPTPDLHIVLPNLTELRSIVSRLGHIADDVKISANREGAMILSVDDDRCNLSTTWAGLHNPKPTSGPEEGEEEAPAHKLFSTKVTIRALLKFLNSHLLGGAAIACICEDHCIIAYVYIGEVNEAGGVLTFFVPAKNTGDEY